MWHVVWFRVVGTILYVLIGKVAGWEGTRWRGGREPVASMILPCHSIVVLGVDRWGRTRQRLTVMHGIVDYRICGGIGLNIIAGTIWKSRRLWMWWIGNGIGRGTKRLLDRRIGCGRWWFHSRRRVHCCVGIGTLLAGTPLWPLEIHSLPFPTLGIEPWQLVPCGMPPGLSYSSYK